MRRLLLLLLCFFYLFIPHDTFALQPENVLVVANSFFEGSVDVARYYMKKRGIPEQNLLKVSTTRKEGCTREDYDYEIARPVRKAVLSNKKIRAIVTIYGIPLGVGRPKLDIDEAWQLKLLKEKSRDIKEALKGLDESVDGQKNRLVSEMEAVKKKIRVLEKADYSAAVDSELTLVLNENFDLKFWQPNPYFVGNRNKTLAVEKDKVLLVSRVDGPSVEIVKRMIEDSLAAEKNGLHGKAYFDAKGPHNGKSNLGGYAYYDNSLNLAADRIRARGLMPVVVNRERGLFQPGEAPEAALYSGWYSYRNYIDAFDWVPGAVGYHIASLECHTLREGKSKAWCKSMLEDGASVVIGPVGEPYVQAFPVPEIFFHYLTDGYYSLVESYFLSLPYLSWRMVLVGDPLYRPFKNSNRQRPQE